MFRRMFWALTLSVMSAASLSGQTISAEDITSIRNKLGNIRSFIVGFKGNAVFTDVENKLAEATSIFSVKETREMFDSVAGTIANVGKVASAVGGLVTGGVGLVSLLVTDPLLKEQLTSVMGYSASLTATLGGLTLGIDLFTASQKAKIATLTSTIAVARQAYDDFLTRREAYKAQLAVLTAIERDLGGLIGLGANIATPDALSRITGLSNDLLRFSALVSDTLAQLKSHVDHYVGITRDVARFVQGDASAVVSKYEEISGIVETGLEYYRAEMRPELEGLNQLMVRVAILPGAQPAQVTR